VKPHSPITLGGQAVIEGVLVHSPRFASLAIRTPQGRLDVETRPVSSLILSRPWLRAPLVRGVVALVDGLSVGTWALMTSARAAQPDNHAVLSPGRIRLILARSLVISIVLFFLTPVILVRALGGIVASPLGQNLLEGGLRVALVLGFIALIGRMPPIQRVFQYHGAEHKAIHAYEAGLPLTVDSAGRASRFHERCGSTFLIMVLLVAVVVFALLGHPSVGVRLAERVVLLPIIAGVSYELIRLAYRSRSFRLLIAPGLWLQHLTTREPNAEELNVALTALREVLAREEEWTAGRPKPHP
jgi:uncharacterized protein YqhQ